MTSTMADEEFMELPCSVTWGQNGMSFDIGGSLIKLAFCRSNKDTGLARINFRSYPLSQFDEAMDYVLENHSDLLELDATVCCSGLGIGDRSQAMYDKLKIRGKTVSELDCFVEAFSCLYETLPREKMIHAESEVGRAYLLRQQAEWSQMIHAQQSFVEKGEQSTNWSPKEHETPKTQHSHPQGTYPVLLVILGSGFGAFRIDAANKYQFVDPGTRSGKFFLGLGSLLTGAQNFDDLVQMAEKGDSERVQVLGKHVKTGNKDDVYSVIPNHMPLYCFGQADIAQTVFLNMKLHKTESVFFCGSFCGLSQVVRDEVSKHFMSRASSQKTTDHGFMKFGGHLGALGALLRTLKAKQGSKIP